MYREERIKADFGLMDGIPRGLMVPELARLLAPYEPHEIDETAVLEAVATYMLEPRRKA